MNVLIPPFLTAEGLTFAVFLYGQVASKICDQCLYTQKQWQRRCWCPFLKTHDCLHHGCGPDSPTVAVRTMFNRQTLYAVSHFKRKKVFLSLLRKLNYKQENVFHSHWLIDYLKKRSVFIFSSCGSIFFVFKMLHYYESHVTSASCRLSSPACTYIFLFHVFYLDIHTCYSHKYIMFRRRMYVWDHENLQ